MIDATAQILDLMRRDLAGLVARDLPAPVEAIEDSIARLHKNCFLLLLARDDQIGWTLSLPKRNNRHARRRAARRDRARR